ncbi:putative quinol monooxygenase [Pontibacter korlensis]|uniref:putative quinol monooxygenase n=1 Tax=Pontibacter korlensis TaxID=400092 RepID=UPI00061ACF19|nr:putative quinol monooxygenase [Pontibacter korlensis]
MLYIIGIIKIQSEAIETLLALFEPLVSATRLEPGCHRYEVHRTTSDPAVFIMMEEFQSEEDFQAHSQSEHFQKFASSIQPLLAEPLQIYITQQIF